MKIICAGYWKTGTKSLAEALRILGYKVYDFDDQYFEIGDLWDHFYNGTVTDEEIYSALKDVDVLIDGPVIAFWEEIHKVFPEAKIILTSRDENSWYKSYQGMHDGITFRIRLQFFMAIFFPGGLAFHRKLIALLRFCNGIEGPMSSRLSDNPRLYKLKFRKHNSYVLHRAPKEKLLVHESKEGWGPLCKFLGHEVPDLLYPKKNKAGTVFIEVSQNPRFLKLMKRSEILLFVLAAALAIALCYVFSRIMLI